MTRTALPRPAIAAALAASLFGLPALATPTAAPAPPAAPTAATPPVAPVPAAASRSFTPGPFDRLKFSGSAQVRYLQGDRDELVVEGDEASVAALEVLLREGRLVVSQPGTWKFWKGHRLQMRVISRELRAVDISGAADFVAAEPVQVKDMDLSISGAGLVRFEQLKADRLSFTVSGSGDGQLAGAVQELQVRISGRGDFVAPRLQAQVARVSISGLGRAKVWATQELNASVSGVGSIEYWGNPPKGQRRLSGLGSLESRGATPPEK